jgi:hypothetical protein
VPRWQRVYLTACALVIGYAGTYSLAEWSAWPKLFYFPLRGEWALYGRPPTPLAMGYLGLVAWGAGGALVAAAAAWLVSGWLPALGDRAIKLVGAWTLTAFLLAGTFFTWNLWPF